MLYYIDKNWYHFINKYIKQFSKFDFQEVTGPVGRPDAFWEFYLLTDILWLPKTIGWVLGHSWNPLPPGGRTFQKLSHLEGDGTKKNLLESGDNPERGKGHSFTLLSIAFTVFVCVCVCVCVWGGGEGGRE